MNQPVISQAVNLTRTYPYLGYTVIPWNHNDLSQHKN